MGPRMSEDQVESILYTIASFHMSTRACESSKNNSESTTVTMNINEDVDLDWHS